MPHFGVDVGGRIHAARVYGTIPFFRKNSPRFRVTNMPVPMDSLQAWLLGQSVAGGCFWCREGLHLNRNNYDKRTLDVRSPILLFGIHWRFTGFRVFILSDIKLRFFGRDALKLPDLRQHLQPPRCSSSRRKLEIVVSSGTVSRPPNCTNRRITAVS